MPIDHRNGISVITHPLAQHILTDLRETATDSVAFRRELERLGRVCGTVLAAEYLDTEPVTVETPLASARGQRLTDSVVLIGVLRAAVPFVEGLLDALPQARQGLVAASRDEHAGMDEDGQFPIALNYVNLPRIHESDVVIVADPMLATGSTMSSVLAEVHDGTTPAKTIGLSAVSAPAGIEHVAEEFPATELVTVGHDERLDENGFIVPGLGDAGDRAFGTEE